MKLWQKILIWAVVVLGLTVTVETYLLWSGKKTNTALARDIDARMTVNDSLKRTIAFLHSADQARNLAWHLKDSLKTREIDSMKQILVVDMDSLKTSKKAVQQVVADFGTQVAALNDPVLKKQYDSVVNELDDLYMLGGVYFRDSDTTMAAMDQRHYQDSVMITTLNMEVSDLKKSLTACTLNFDGLDKDSAKLQKQIRTRAVISKLRTIGEAILAAIAIFKK